MWHQFVINYYKKVTQLYFWWFQQKKPTRILLNEKCKTSVPSKFCEEIQGKKCFIKSLINIFKRKVKEHKHISDLFVDVLSGYCKFVTEIISEIE
jgi:hypothetical protein